MRIFQWIVAGIIGLVLGLIVGAAMVNKASLYGWAKTALEPYGIELIEGSLKAGTWGVWLEDVQVRYKGGTVLRAQNLELGLWSAKATRIELEGMVQQAMPPRIQEATLNLLGFDEFLVVSGDFGKGVGMVDFSKFRFTMTPSEEMKRGYLQSLRAFKAKGEGYVYDFTF